MEKYIEKKSSVKLTVTRNGVDNFKTPLLKKKNPLHTNKLTYLKKTYIFIPSHLIYTVYTRVQIEEF